LTLAADAILALAKGGDEDDPDAEWVGAYLVAEYFAIVRKVLTGKR